MSCSSRRILVLLVGVVLVAVACSTTPTVVPGTSSSAPGASSSGGTSPAATTKSFIKQPNPIAVAEHLDPAKAATATIGAGGGTLSATGSDGVKFTLTFPKGALLESNMIKMTPVTSIDSLPYHALLAAVHLEPDGLLLKTAATLMIEGAGAPASGDAALGIGYTGVGANLHLQPMKAGNALTLQVAHFSSAGAADGTQQDFTNQLQHAPDTIPAQLEQEVAAIDISSQVHFKFEDGSQIDSSQLAGSVQAAVNEAADALRPIADAAIKSGDFNAITDAIAQATQIERTAELLGLDSPAARKLMDDLFNAIPKLYKDYVNACFGQNDLKKGVLALGIARAALLLGFDVDTGPLYRCLRVHVEFITEFKGTTAVLPTTTTADLHANSEPINMVGGSNATAPLVYDKYEFDPPPILRQTGCALMTTTKVDGPASVVRIGGLELKNNGKSFTWNLSDFVVVFLEGKASETTVMSCPHPIQIPIQLPATDSTFYVSNWEHAHAEELTQEGYQIKGWTTGSGKILATKTYTRTFSPAPQFTIDETTTFKIIHDPEGSGIP